MAGYDDQSVTVNNKRYTRSIVFGSAMLPQDWTHPGFDAEHAQQLAQSLVELVQPGTEVILLGTGNKQIFPPISARKVWAQARLAVEVMDTAAACRTYNILLAEGRPVMAALIIHD